MEEASGLTVDLQDLDNLEYEEYMLQQKLKKDVNYA